MVSCAPIVNRCSRAQPGPGVSTFSNSDKTAGRAGGLAAGVLCAPVGWSHVGQAKRGQLEFRCCCETSCLYPACPLLDHTSRNLRRNTPVLRPHDFVLLGAT